MGDREQCRMLLKSGKRCRNAAKSNGMCGIHSRSLRAKRELLDSLLKAGQVGSALSGLVKIVETVYPYAEHVVKHFGLLLGHLKFSATYRHATRSDVLRYLKDFQSMECKGEAFDASRVVGIVFEGMTWTDPTKPFEAYGVARALEEEMLKEQLRSYLSRT
jgi:hypothetical protein